MRINPLPDKLYNDMMYVCCLIEFIGRETKNRRCDVVKYLGRNEIARLIRVADCNHCLPFGQVCYEEVEDFNIPTGDFDSVGRCQYKVPYFIDIGMDYARLVEDVRQEGEEIADTVVRVFTSFISDAISNFNSSMFYSSREYLAASFEAGYPLE